MCSESDGMRWDPYVLVQEGEFDGFWREHLGNGTHDVLVIVGRGFDVRALDASTRLMGLGGQGRRDAWVIDFDNGQVDSSQRATMTAANYAGYKQIFGSGLVRDVNIALGDAQRPTATSRNTKKAFGDKTALQCYDDIVLDISAVPRMVALTALAVLIAQLDDVAEKQGKDINLHVMTAESVTSDRNTASGSLSDVVTTVVGFLEARMLRARNLCQEYGFRYWEKIKTQG